MGTEFKTVAVETQEDGTVEAVFSVFNTIDSDQDVVRPNSLKSFKGENVPMVWSHDWNKVIGKGKIVQDNDKATFKGKFNLKTEVGKEAYESVKFMEDLQQWSFGFEVLDSEVGEFKTSDDTTEQVRYINEAKVYEVSPVLVGANQETETVLVKEDKTTVEDNKKSDRENNLSFSDEAKEVLEALISFTKRAKSLGDLRYNEQKQLGKKASHTIELFKDGISLVHAELDDLIAKFDETEEVEVLNNQDELNSLLIETQEALINSTNADVI